VTGKLAQVKIGNFPQTSLAAERLKLNELKLLRQEGRCPASELKQDKLQRAIEAEQANIPELTVLGLVELYLTERIEDRKTKDGKIIPGARKPKGQAEVRRTLYFKLFGITLTVHGHLSLNHLNGLSPRWRKKISALIPLRKRAGYWPVEYADWNRAVANQRLSGSKARWKWTIDYNRRSIAETAMYRVKHYIGEALTLRDYDGQVAEALAMVRALNKMTTAGMPDSVHIA
jgi:hypothetical protein